MWMRYTLSPPGIWVLFLHFSLFLSLAREFKHIRSVNLIALLAVFYGLFGA